MISLGVPAGATRPYQVVASKPWVAEFVDRGDTRQERAAPDGRDRECAQPAGPYVIGHQGGRRKHHLHMAADDVLQRRPRLLVWDMDEVRLGLDLEQLAGEMGRAAVA